MNQKIVTIILAHYNQFEFYKKALDSILSQKYGMIELIFADDATQNINEKKIKDYVEKHKKENLCSYTIQINEKNLGTPKNLNIALSKAKGDYILLFAADDALYDENTIENYVREIEKTEEDVCGIFFQSLLYDSKLEKIYREFSDPFIEEKRNSQSSFEQFQELTLNCYLPMGAMFFKKGCFEKHGYFDEKYKIIEDWTYFLKLTRSGAKFVYRDYNGLKHRSGGVSHYEGHDLPPHVYEYKNDTLIAFEEDILPYIKDFELEKQLEIYVHYNSIRKEFAKLGIPRIRKSRFEILKDNPKLFLYNIYRSAKHKIELNRNLNLKLCLVCFVFWMLTSLYGLLHTNRQVDNLYFSNGLMILFIVFCVLYIISLLMKIKNKLNI